MTPPQPAPEDAKARGAYYTADPVAAFMTRWALREPRERVLDPSFGGGVFLRAAARRLRELGADPASVARGVTGVEIDPEAHATAQLELVPEGVTPGALRLGDFLALERGELEPVDALIGNPPYVRYQQLSREQRARAARRAAEGGAPLGGRAGLWAPFTVHALRFVRPGGRLALVLPGEFDHAAYARPLLPLLARTFERIALLTFAAPLFPRLDQDALLLLADGRRPEPDVNQSALRAALGWRDLPGPEALTGTEGDALLAALAPQGWAASGADGTLRSLTAADAARRGALRAALLSPATLARYRELAGSARAPRLADLAEVRLGYVTGANRFFHLSPARAAELELPEAALAPAVYRGAALRGLRFDRAAWRGAAERGHAGWLLRLGRDAPEHPRLADYLAQGEASGVPRGHKCRTREPWYRVPSARPPDAALAAMSAAAPALVANPARAAVANALLRVDLRGDAPVTPTTLALLWRSSLAALGCELEGHPLGGGMLKLEPSAARRVPVPLPAGGRDRWTALAEAIDAAARSGAAESALRARVDAALVAAGALDADDAARFARGVEILRGRRR